MKQYKTFTYFWIPQTKKERVCLYKKNVLFVSLGINILSIYQNYYETVNEKVKF